MADAYGSAGAEWLGQLPAIVERRRERWSLRLESRIEPLSYNYVMHARRADGSRVVLKAGYPCRELMCEMAALRIYGGRGSVRLLEADEADGALLLERVEPGKPLEEAADDVEATSIAARVMQALWRPAPATHDFPTTADWGRGFTRLRRAFDGGAGPFPAALVDEAEDLFQELNATAASPAVLHGDLHHGNILDAGAGEWRAIDPKGLVGEPAYDVGALLRNPRSLYTTMPDPRQATARRVSQLADELGFDRERIRGWGFAQAVLSAWWTYEDHGKIGEFALACAGWLRDA